MMHCMRLISQCIEEIETYQDNLKNFKEYIELWIPVKLNYQFLV